MPIIILTLVFPISNPKSIFGQIWAEKVKAVCFAWKLAHIHTHIHTQRVCWSRGWWFLFQYLFFQISNLNLEDTEIPNLNKWISWANLSRERWILHFAWKLVYRVFWGCDCKNTEEGLEAKIKMNNFIRCFLLLYFYRS